MTRIHSSLMRRYALLMIILLGISLRVGYALAIYEPSLLNYNVDDFVSYRNAADDILRGDLAFTNSLYMKRPPLYALLVAALQIQPMLVILANIALGTVIIPLAYKLARQFFLSREYALLAALIIAIDAASIRQSANLRADALASLLLAIAFVCLLKLQHADTATIAVWGLLSGTLIILSAFTRPAAYLLWIPMSLWVVLARDGGGRFLAILSLSAIPVFGIGIWQSHNAVYFHNPSFSTAGAFQLLYVRAASVLHQATDQDLDAVYATLAARVELKLGNEVDGITANWRHRHLASSSKMQSAMTDVAVTVFLEHPLYYILTFPLGIFRALLKVTMWPPWLGIGWNAILLATSGFGLLKMAKERQVVDVLFLLLPCLYFLTGTLLVATASFDTRARVMVTPLLAIMAAHGLRHLLNRRRAASAGP